MSDEKPALIYIGDGAFVVGIPARNLTAAEVKTHGGEKRLLNTELYALPESAAKKPKVKGD